MCCFHVTLNRVPLGVWFSQIVARIDPIRISCAGCCFHFAIVHLHVQKEVGVCFLYPCEARYALSELTIGTYHLPLSATTRWRQANRASPLAASVNANGTRYEKRLLVAHLGYIRWCVAIAIRGESCNPGRPFPTGCYLPGRFDLSQQRR